MSVRWLDEAAQRAFADAVGKVEAGSAAEVIVAVRRSARRWPHVPLAVGIVAAWLALAFMMFSDHPFSHLAITVDPLIAGLLAGGAATLVPALVRWLTPAAIRRRAVVEAARAAFYTRGVHHTRGRTGVLVYCALTERMAELVADDGIVRAVDAAAWRRAAAAVDAALPRGGVATAAAVAALADLLATAVPRERDDANELPDAIDHDLGAAIHAAVAQVKAVLADDKRDDKPADAPDDNPDDNPDDAPDDAPAAPTATDPEPRR